MNAVTMSEEGPAKRQVIESVARASRILLAVARSPHGLTGAEVATGVGLAMPTAYSRHSRKKNC